MRPADPLSAQLLEETARIEAIDDTLYALGTAFRDMEDPAAQQAVRASHFSLPHSFPHTKLRCPRAQGLPSYLKEVHRLARAQFRSKVLQQKIMDRRAVLA